jgi:hypothetical protein
VVALLCVLLPLFTGPLTPVKARLLFAFTYALTFTACLIPLLAVVFMSTSSYLRSLMYYSPVGIVLATTEGVDAVKEDPGWWVNLGGSLIPAQQTESPKRATESAEQSKNKGGGTAASGRSGATGQQQSSEPPTDQTQPDQSLAQGNQAAIAGASANLSGNPVPALKRGLAVPLYVLILALMGAAINMTRLVPGIQNDSDSGAGMTLLSAPANIFRAIFAPGARAVMHVPRGAEIRRQVIETYMYFLSAPVLVIAVYYLLKAVATPTQPALVVIAFATGLMTNTAAKAIVRYADKLFKNLGADEAEEEKKKKDQEAENARKKAEADRKKAPKAGENPWLADAEANKQPPGSSQQGGAAS